MPHPLDLKVYTHLSEVLASVQSARKSLYEGRYNPHQISKATGEIEKIRGCFHRAQINFPKNPTPPPKTDLIEDTAIRDFWLRKLKAIAEDADQLKDKFFNGNRDLDALGVLDRDLLLARESFRREFGKTLNGQRSNRPKF